MNIQPLKGLVLIRIEKVEQANKPKTSIITPKEKWAKPVNTAVVLAIGNEVTAVTVGQTVLINPYGVIDTAENDTKLIREKDLLAIWQSQPET